MIMAFLRKLFKRKAVRPQPIEVVEKTEQEVLVAPLPPIEEKIPVPEPVIGEELEGDKEVKSVFKEEATMYPEGIKDYETQFDNTHRDSDGVKYDVENSTAFTFPLSVIKPQGVTDFFYPDEFNKTSIVLHFTVGFLMGDLATLIEQDSHMSVPFVIGRNGTVYQLFNSAYWSYHLGRGSIGGNAVNSKRSIAIELSNIGPLSREGDVLNNIYGTKYCTIEETDFYTKLDSPYRKYTYYSTFTEEQYESLSNLISYLCGKHNIPREFLPVEKRYRVFADAHEAQAFEGICTHVNYRADGKVDIGPAFDWDKIIDIS